jgi:hypothetical protein
MPGHLTRNGWSPEPPKKDKPGRTSDWLNWVLMPAATALALVSFAHSWQNRKLAAQLQKQSTWRTRTSRNENRQKSC